MQVYESQLDAQNRLGQKSTRQGGSVAGRGNSKRNKHDENGDLLNDGDESDSEERKGSRPGAKAGRLFDDENLGENEDEEVAEKFGKQKLNDSE